MVKYFFLYSVPSGQLWNSNGTKSPPSSSYTNNVLWLSRSSIDIMLSNRPIPRCLCNFGNINRYYTRRPILVTAFLLGNVLLNNSLKSLLTTRFPNFELYICTGNFTCNHFDNLPRSDDTTNSKTSFQIMFDWSSWNRTPKDDYQFKLRSDLFNAGRNSNSSIKL